MAFRNFNPVADLRVQRFRQNENRLVASAPASLLLRPSVSGAAHSRSDAAC